MPAEVRRLSVPPHSIPAEQAVLGSVLLNWERAWARVATLMTGADFYEPRHRTIWVAMAVLAGEHRAIDTLSLVEHLTRRKQIDDVGGAAYIHSLERNTPTAENVETYAAVVRERSSLRRLRSIGMDLAHRIDEGAGESATALAADLQEALMSMQARLRIGKGLVDADALATELIHDLERRADGRSGLQTGLADFDHLTSGCEPGDLVLLGARPAMGKTAVGGQIALNVSRHAPVAVFSAEMPALQLTRRAASHVSGIDQGRFRRPEKMSEADWSGAVAAVGEISKLKLHVDDTPAPTLAHIRSECVALKSRAGLALIVVDYVQLLRGSGESRYHELRDIAYGLKSLAKDLAVPVIALAQLNRNSERDGHRRPNASDLRDSGGLEEAADVIGLLYSESVHNSSFPVPDVVECLVVKNRNGKRGECFWKFDGAHSRVTLLSPDELRAYRLARDGMPPQNFPPEMEL